MWERPYLEIGKPGHQDGKYAISFYIRKDCRIFASISTDNRNVCEQDE